VVRVLVVEDNEELLANVAEFLDRRGVEVDAARRGDHALELASAVVYDAIVLDLGLPGLDGIDTCRELRRRGRTTPLLMLTARDGLDDKLSGFAAGADDYLVKPFALPELFARLVAVVGRAQRRGAGSLQVADLSLDPTSRRVLRGGRELSLSPVGFRVLEHLMRESPRVVPRGELESLLWGDDPPPSDALRSHLHALRRAVDRPFDTPLLHTVHGVGVRLSDDRHT